MPERKLLTTDQATDYLSVRPGYLRRLVRERRIRHVKVGRFVRFDLRDLDGFIDGGRVDPLLALPGSAPPRVPPRSPAVAPAPSFRSSPTQDPC